MIIYGTRGITYTKKKGEFYCPECSTFRPFKLRRQRLFFTLYFIPTIPLNMLAEYVECQHCESAYDPRVLELGEAASAAAVAFRAAYIDAVRRVMVEMMLADGIIEEEEEDIIKFIYYELTDHVLSDEELEEDISYVSSPDFDVSSYLEGLAEMFEDSEKELILRAAFLVACSDGEIHRDEILYLTELAGALKMSDSHLDYAMERAISSLNK